MKRRAVRILPINPAGEVLLMRCVDPARPREPFWVTIGGGLEIDETERQAGIRELWEETGIVVEPARLVGPLHHEVVRFSWGGEDVEQEQSYFVARVDGAGVTAEHQDAIERQTTLEFGWWTAATLRASGQRAVPALLSVLDELL